MSLQSLLSDLIPSPARHVNRLFDALLWRGLLALAVLCLFVAAWRTLELFVGPILGPLVLATALALVASVLAFLDAREKRREKSKTPPIAPLVATVLEIAFAPKIVRWFALGSLIYDTVINGKSPLTPRRK